MANIRNDQCSRQYSLWRINGIVTAYLNNVAAGGACATAAASYRRQWRRNLFMACLNIIFGVM